MNLVPFCSRLPRISQMFGRSELVSKYKIRTIQLFRLIADKCTIGYLLKKFMPLVKEIMLGNEIRFLRV